MAVATVAAAAVAVAAAAVAVATVAAAAVAVATVAAAVAVAIIAAAAITQICNKNMGNVKGESHGSAFFIEVGYKEPYMASSDVHAKRSSLESTLDRMRHTLK